MGRWPDWPWAFFAGICPIRFYPIFPFKRVLEEQIEKRKVKLIVDLEKVTWIDTVGAGALREGLEKTLSRNGKLWLIYDKSRVRKFLAVTRLQEIFIVFKTKNQALKKLGIDWSV